MKILTPLNDRDCGLIASRIRDFVPSEVYDFHVHPYEKAHFGPEAFKYIQHLERLGCADHQASIKRLMPATRVVHGLYFGMPHASGDRPAINAWVAGEVRANGAPLSRALLLVSPKDDPAAVAAELRSGRFCGLKVYHCFANRPDTMNATIPEYAPEWMWEIAHETRGLLMLHIVRNGAMDDPDNQRDIRRLCRAYPNCTLVLAHVARSFNYRNGRSGLHTLTDLDNVVVDTSAVAESEAFAAALQTLGPRRIHWGSDYFVSEMRGRCVSTGSLFFWLQPEVLRTEHSAPTTTDMTLVGIESLLCLREACEDAGLNRGDIEDIFLNNALRTLRHHLPKEAAPAEAPGPALWAHARSVIAGGTGLLSKRAEQFDARDWPAYFSRASGCQVWDLAGKRYIDFAGGIGAVVLGYADPDVTAAVRRRLLLGTYSTLVSPQEVELADALLSLHPWAGKVRYVRGGGEADMVAVRVARAATGRSGIAFCGYHGWHDWYLAANLAESSALDGHLLPGLEPRGVPRELRGTSVPFRYNDLPSLEAALAKLGSNLAAVVMEPMRSQWPKDDFVAKAAALCRKAGGVFVVDEVSSCLRLGYPGALSRLGVEPDLVTYAKAMGNGFPFGAIVGRESVFKAAGASFISSSYWTDGVGPAAALAVLEKAARTGVHELVWSRGARLQESLRKIAERHPLCRLLVGGLPPVPTMVFDLGEDSPLALTLYARKMKERGFLIGVNYYVMLAHEEPLIAQLLETIDPVMDEMEQAISRGTLATEAAVERGVRGFARLA